MEPSECGLISVELLASASENGCRRAIAWFGALWLRQRGADCLFIVAFDRKCFWEDQCQDFHETREVNCLLSRLRYCQKLCFGRRCSDYVLLIGPQSDYSAERLHYIVLEAFPIDCIISERGITGTDKRKDVSRFPSYRVR